eukprot:s653_g18.t1
MVQGWSSRVFREPSGGDGRGRDIFPLPLLEESGPWQASLSRSTQRRIFSRKAIAVRANKAITALNSLFFGSEHWGKPTVVKDLADLPLCQSDCLKNILNRVRQLGSPAEDACCQGALQALRTAGNSYDEPEPGVGSVVAMQMERLSLPSGKVAGVSLADHLSGSVRDMVCDYEGHMLQDASVWTDLEEQASKLTPYDDPLLKTHEGYLAFLSHLYRCGILGFSSECRGRVGAFCVSKKPKVVDGILQERQRLVLDCRAVNLLFKEPPRTRLGSLSCLSESLLNPDQQLFVATADICDCFYACDVPQGMEQYFCLKSDISLADAVEVTGGSADLSSLEGLDWVSPCITVLPMGFNWSFYLVQVLHEQAALSALGIDESRLFLEGSPPPQLSEGYCCTMPYCDNVHVLSCSSSLCQRGKDDVVAKLESMGFVLHEHTSADTFTQTLGGIIDGELGLVKCTPKRIWSLIFAFDYIANHKVSPELVQRLLGHAMVACVINRSGMCVFRKLYDFVQQGGRPRRLNADERRECQIFSGILPLLVADLRRPWSSCVTATDGSPAGWGICERELPVQHVQAVGRWQERWRFRRLAPSEWKPRERTVKRDPFSDPLTSRGNLGNLDESDMYTVNEGFPEVPLWLLDEREWVTVSMGKWKHTSEHITLKEGLGGLPPRQTSRMGLQEVRSSRVLTAKSVLKKPKNPSRTISAKSAVTVPKETRQLRAPLQVVSKKAGKASQRILPSQSKNHIPRPQARRTVHALVSPVQQEPSNGKRARLNLLTQLEQRSVSVEVQHQYDMYYKRFLDFCLENGEEVPREVEMMDAMLADYMDICFLDGRTPHEGEKTMAAIEFKHVSVKGRLPRSKRAMKGWKKVMPSQSRLPLPRTNAFGLAMELAAAGRKSMALKVIVDFILYLRPGEGLGLTGRNIVAPVRSAGVQFKWVTIVVRDFEGLRPDKVGVFDNSIPIDRKEESWVGTLLLQKARQLPSKDHHLFDFSMEEFRTQFTAAGRRLGLENLHPYQLRHGGATHDLTSKVRDHSGVKARGRWMTDSSVRRYTKVGRVQQLLNKLTKGNLKFCQWSEKNLSLVLQSLKPAKSASTF